MKKILILIDSDDEKIISKVKKDFAEESIIVAPKGCLEIWEIDEKNQMKRRIA